ncbi:Sorting nexin-2 [Nymphon striatum]|nr:Sorting nexin-2 [Nymphon striatum]
MADHREPPPFNDESKVSNSAEDDENEDLFTSAVEVQSTKNEVDEEKKVDLFSGGEEVNLNDDVDEEEDENQVETEPTILESVKEESVTPAASIKTENISVTKSSHLDEDEKNEASDQFIEISIRDPQKIGDGMSSYMAYKICTKTNLKYFKKQEFSALRRFSDFLGLHEKLAEKHLHVGRIVPPAPEKSVIDNEQIVANFQEVSYYLKGILKKMYIVPTGTTKMKMSKTEETVSQSEFIEKRRSSLERYLNRTAAHPVLRVDPDFREFLELESDLPKATNTSALSGAGVMRLFSKVGDTVNKITFKMDENNPVKLENSQYFKPGLQFVDNAKTWIFKSNTLFLAYWFEEKQQQIESLDTQLRKLHSSVESLVMHRKDLVGCTSTFAKSVAMLSNCEEHTALSRALSQLAEVEEKVEQLHQNQANCDFYVLSELIKDYIALIGVIKTVFHQRVKVYQTWQHAQQMLTKKREQKAKLELAGKTDKVPQAREEVIEWESKVERCQEEFENTSKMIRKEVERFEFNRVKDFKDIIIKYMESLLNTQQQLVKYWEAFLPEAKAVA